jgi:hypothetical protein
VRENRTAEALERLAERGIEAALVGSMGGKLTTPVPEPTEELWRTLKMEGPGYE